jgi:Cysteine-rich secretory protein family
MTHKTKNNDCSWWTAEYDTVGQIVDMIGSQTAKFDAKPAFDNRIAMWAKQARELTAEDIKKYKMNPATDMFTQLAWANTQKIGCGFAKFNETAKKPCKSSFRVNLNPRAFPHEPKTRGVHCALDG